jgi:hypothetical protein
MGGVYVTAGSVMVTMTAARMRRGVVGHYFIATLEESTRQDMVGYCLVTTEQESPELVQNLKLNNLLLVIPMMQ